MLYSLQQFPEDSINTYSFEEQPETIVVYKPCTPREVLRMLPSDATPSEQDSAVQAMLDIPPAVHLSECPDTLYIPGLKGSPAHADLSRYSYRNNFFSDSAYFHSELRVTQLGIAGEPLPYRLRSDDYVTGMLLLSFFLVAFFIVHMQHVFLEKLKRLFFRSNNRDLSVNDAIESHIQTLFVIQSSFSAAILFFCYTQMRLPHVCNSLSPYLLLAVDTGLFLFYYTAKIIVYRFVNWVFFDKDKRRLWLETYLLTIMLTGVAAFLLALIVVYFSLPFRAMVITVFAIIGLSKLLLVIKCKQIFFNLNYSIFHLILYFCTLELIPILLLWRALIYCNETLVVNI